MTPTYRSPRLALLTFTFCASLLAQTRPPAAELAANLDRAVGTIELDRAQYFLGEEMRVTHRLRNPTAEPLTVPAPLDEFYAPFRLLPVDNQGRTVLSPSLESEVVFPGSPLDAVPLTTIAPSATLTSEITSLRAAPGRVQLPAAPETPGRYELRYSYDSSFRRLSTVAPIFDAFAETPTGRTGVSLDGETYPTYRAVFALRQQETSYVCVTVDPEQDTAESARRWLGRRVAAGWITYFTPYRRIATVPGRIAQLSISVDAAGNMTIIAIDTAGNQRRIDLDANFNPR